MMHIIGKTSDGIESLLSTGGEEGYVSCRSISVFLSCGAGRAMWPVWLCVDWYMLT